MKVCNEISIIVPVYKAESYLPQCVGSILSQSFGNFELILVDDGSPDASGILCDRYAEADSRIRVLHKANGGVSSARNLGIDHASGDYIVFIDSDDYVGHDYLRDLLDAAGDVHTMVISDYQPFSGNGPEKRAFYPEFSVELDNGSAGDFRKLIFGFQLFPPYCKLYRRDIIAENRIRFDTEMKSAEDFDFNMRYIRNIDRIRYIPSVQYFYRVDYKTYIPSNGEILGHSEIKSVHTMTHGIVTLSKRMGCYEELEAEICIWAAKKHYFNRMRMLFAGNPKNRFWERRNLYRQLIADQNYRSLHRRGIGLVQNCTTKTLGKWCDFFPVWWLFYTMNHLRKNKTG